MSTLPPPSITAAFAGAVSTPSPTAAMRLPTTSTAWAAVGASRPAVQTRTLVNSVAASGSTRGVSRLARIAAGSPGW